MPTNLLKIICVLRKFTSYLIWLIIKPHLPAPTDHGVWERVKKQPITVFNALMAAVKYKSDPLWGVLDYTLYDLDYFFFTGAEDKALYGRDCLPKDEKIFTPTGVKTVGELRVGDQVLSYNFELKKCEYKPVCNIWSSGIKKEYRVKFRNGMSSRMSGSHKLLVTRRYGGPLPKQYHAEPIEDLLANPKKRNRPIKCASLIKYPYTSTDIPWLTRDLCFVLGYYMAEGWKHKRKDRPGYVVCMGGHDIPEHIEPLLLKGGIPYSISYRSIDNLPTVRLSKSIFRDYLVNIKDNSFEFHIPKELNMLPLEKLKSIAEGHLLGDGHIRPSGESTHTTSADNLTEYLIELGFKIGDPFTVGWRSSSGGAGKTPRPIWRIINNPNSYFKKFFGWDGMSEVGVSSITETGRNIDMLDIEVEDNHNFFMASSGCLAHNCDDHAYIWYNYLKDNRIAAETYMILCIDGWKLPTMHFFVVAKFHDGYFRLFNYKIYSKPFATLKEACEQFSKEELTAGGIYKNLKWAVYYHTHNSKDDTHA